VSRTIHNIENCITISLRRLPASRFCARSQAQVLSITKPAQLGVATQVSHNELRRPAPQVGVLLYFTVTLTQFVALLAMTCSLASTLSRTHEPVRSHGGADRCVYDVHDFKFDNNCGIYNNEYDYAYTRIAPYI
jgi:hypothetical protein